MCFSKNSTPAGLEGGASAKTTLTPSTITMQMAILTRVTGEAVMKSGQISARSGAGLSYPIAGAGVEGIGRRNPDDGSLHAGGSLWRWDIRQRDSGTRARKTSVE